MCPLTLEKVFRIGMFTVSKSLQWGLLQCIVPGFPKCLPSRIADRQTGRPPRGAGLTAGDGGGFEEGCSVWLQSQWARESQGQTPGNAWDARGRGRGRSGRQDEGCATRERLQRQAPLQQQAPQISVAQGSQSPSLPPRTAELTWVTYSGTWAHGCFAIWMEHVASSVSAGREAGGRGLSLLHHVLAKETGHFLSHFIGQNQPHGPKGCWEVYWAICPGRKENQILVGASNGVWNQGCKMKEQTSHRGTDGWGVGGAEIPQRVHGSPSLL